MSSNDSGSASPTSTVITRESRKRALEEKQKNFELEKRKRRTKVNLENQADALALETESLQYQEEDLSQYQQDCAHKERKLADSVTAMEHMEQILNTEREKLVELQKTFDEQKERLDWEKQQFSAEKEVIGSLERDFASKQEKLAADEKKLALARERFEDGDDLISVDGSDSEFGCSKRRKNHNLEAESLEENVNCLPGTPTSSHFHAVHSDASEGTNVDNHAFVRDGYGYHLGSPSGEAISAVLSEIRAKRREQNDDTPESVPSEHKSIVVSGKTVEDHRLAILEKAKRVDKPIEDTDRVKHKASDIPADPRTAIPEKMKRSSRVKSFNGVPLVREIGQYVGDVDWFGDERKLSALLAYMTGEVREPCTNCKKAADSGDLHWSQFLMCVTSDKLIGGECCHCHFRSAHYPVCSHRAGGSVSRKKHSSSSTSTKTPDEVAIESQHALEEVKKEEAISVRGSPSTRKVKVDARSEIRRMSAWSIFSGDEEEAEQSDSISWC